MMRRELIQTIGTLVSVPSIGNDESIDIDVYITSDVQGYGSKVTKLCHNIQNVFDIDLNIGPQAVVDVDIDADTAKGALKQWREQGPMTDVDTALLMVSGKHEWENYGYARIGDTHAICRYAELADMMKVALYASHEIGHTLGLRHSDADGTIMEHDFSDVQHTRFSQASRSRLRRRVQ